MAQKRYQVIIAGAGPVGLLIAHRLGQAGIQTLVIERHADVLPTTRAVVYQPVVIPALKQLGFLEQVMENSYRNNDGIFWRNLSGQTLAKLPVGNPRGGTKSAKEGFDGIILLGQQRMTKLVLRELEKMPSVEMRWSTSVVGVENMPSEDNASFVEVHCRQHETNSSVSFAADWLLGTDGANSMVRHACGISFDGFTWDTFKMIGADVWHDFARSNGYAPMNFIVDPDKWAVIIYCGEDSTGNPYGTGTPFWRVAFPVPPESSEEQQEILQLCLDHISQYARGTRPEDIHISRAEPYVMHQRCADQARKGRVLLAGDALHSNNPIGGLGLTTGVVDACCYANALLRVVVRGEPDMLLTECANSRRQAWLNATNPISIENIKRLMSTTEEDVNEREHFFTSLRNNPKSAAQWSAQLIHSNRNLFIPDLASTTEVQ